MLADPPSLALWHSVRTGVIARRAERIKHEIVQAAEARRKELLSGKLTRAVKPSFVFLDKTEKIEGFEVYNVGHELRSWSVWKRLRGRHPVW